jgi:hypothetical protein
MNQETKNIVGLLVNLVIPGLGTIIWGEQKIGTIQIVSFFVGGLLSAIGIGALIVAGIWIWALVLGIQRVSAGKPKTL